MRKVIVNGANGFLASNFIHELLNEKYEVIALVRGGDDIQSKQKMFNSLNLVSSYKQYKIKNLIVYNYDLLNLDFQIPSFKLSIIFNKDVDYFHFAACLKHNEKAKDEIFETNIQGVENSIKVFQKYASKNSRFFFISTAYSCGKRSGRFEEKFYNNDGISYFRNYYEQSKRFGENVVKQYSEMHDLKTCIIRPSQVVGDSNTGITKTDFGIFDFTKRVCHLAYRYPNETIRIKADPDSTQNLIPINTVVYYLMQTIRCENLPAVMNYVSKVPLKNNEIINCICSLLPIKIIFDKSLDKLEMNTLERLIKLGMAFTGDYCNTNLQFDTTNLDRVVGISGREISGIELQKMLTYFITSFLIKKQMQIYSCLSLSH